MSNWLTGVVAAVFGVIVPQFVYGASISINGQTTQTLVEPLRDSDLGSYDDTTSTSISDCAGCLNLTPTRLRCLGTR
jgi:hypothetical protein